MARDKGAPPRPPGDEGRFSVSRKDVVMGRGSGTQNHCGNVSYRKLVYLNKELYATSSKFDKLKISKAIVAAVREFGGQFLQADEKRGGLYYDIGDKRAWDKTSQALREGQAEIRAKLAEEDPEGMSKVAEYKKVISEQTFFAYACKMMETLQPKDDESDVYAQRRELLNKMGAHPLAIHSAMQSMTPPPLPSPQANPYTNMQPSNVYQQGTGYNTTMTGQVSPSSLQRPGYPPNTQNIEPIPLNPPKPQLDSAYEPLPFNTPPLNHGNSAPQAPAVSHAHQETIEPIPYRPNPTGPPKPSLINRDMSAFSTGSVFSLRKFVGEDFEIDSEEGKVLMDQLNQEVDDLIRRKSQGLIQIDTMDAFEDLVFDEDSNLIRQNEITEETAELKRPAPTSTVDTNDGDNAKPSAGGRPARYSALSHKDDVSLMNMSILTIDDKDEGDARGHSSENFRMDSLDSIKDDVGTKNSPKSIIRPSSGAKRERDQRVSFNERNMSLMSMDERSFSNLVETVSEPGRENLTNDMSSDVQRYESRKLGFPVRRNVLNKMDDMPSEVGQSSGGESQLLSSLTVIDDDDPQGGSRVEGSTFTKMAGAVDDPKLGNSLAAPQGMSLSNLSTLGGSSIMSLDVDDL